MLTEKEISRLRKGLAVRWLPIVPLFMTGMNVLTAGFMLYYVHRISAAAGLSWGDAVRLLVLDIDATGTYEGYKILIVQFFVMAFMFFGGALVMVVAYFAMRFQRRKDRLLLAYIDGERGKEPADGSEAPLI